MADKPNPAELQQLGEEQRKKTLAEFPFPRYEVSGDQALATWYTLRAEGRGAPVVVGSEETLVRLADLLPDWPRVPGKTPASDWLSFCNGGRTSSGLA